MRKLIITLIVLAVIIAAVFITKPFFVLEEGDQAIILRFGRVVTSHQEAGLHLKVPVVDNVVFFPKRIQSWNGRMTGEGTPTKEAKYILIDTSARWRITNVETFYAKVKTLEDAYDRLDKIVESRIKDIVAQNNLSEAVRNTNVILNFPTNLTEDLFNSLIISKIKKQTDIEFVKSLYLLNDEGKFQFKLDNQLSAEKRYWDILTTIDFTLPAAEAVDAVALIRQNYDTTSTTLEAVEKGRLYISKEILNQVQQETPLYGIEIIDIIIRQIRYSDSLKNVVYERMIQERKQLAEAFRSYGSGQKEEWIGRMNAEQEIILSEARATAEAKKGDADAEATRIYSEAYEGSEKFYTFWRSLESYKQVLKSFDKTITTEMQYFDFLYGN